MEDENELNAVIPDSKVIDPTDLLLQYEEESEVDLLNQLNRNANAPDLLDTSGVFSNLTQTNDYLSKEDSVEGLLDLNELQGQSQSGIKQFGLMFPRIGNKILTEIAKLPGTLAGVGEAVFTYSSFAEAMDNSWIKAIDSFSEHINEQVLPIYATKAVKEGNLWDNISSTEFWATEGADGIGFMASMLVPGLALSKLGAGAKIIKGLSKPASKVLGGHKKALETMSKLGINSKNIDLFNATMANTMFEAGSEASGAMDGYEQSLLSKLNNKEIDQEQFEELLVNKAKVGRDVFTSNMGILLLPNLITNKILLGGSKSKLLKSDFYEKGTKNLVKELTNKTTKESTKRYLKEFAKGFAREGFLEEGLQNAVENYVKDSTMSGNEDRLIKSQLNFLGDLPSTYWDTISSTEGQKAIFLGGILGGGMNAINLYKTDKKDNKRKSNILDAINNSLESYSNSLTDVWKRNKDGELVLDENGFRVKDITKIKKAGFSLQQIEDTNQALTEAEQAGDEMLVKTLKHQMASALTMPFLSEGKEGIEILKEQLNQLQSLKDNIEKSNKDFKNTTRRSEFVDDIIKNAESMQKDYELFRDYGSDIITLKNKDATKEEKNSFYEKIKNVYTLTNNRKRFLENYRKDIETSLQEAVNNLIGDTTFETEEIKKNYLRENLLPYKRMEEILKDSDKYIKQIDKQIKSLWNNEELNKEFNKEVNDRISTESKLEKEEKVVTETIKEVKAAKTTEEVDNALESTEGVSEETSQYVEEVANNRKDDITEQEEVAAQSTEAEIVNESDLTIHDTEGVKEVTIDGQKHIAKLQTNDKYKLFNLEAFNGPYSGKEVTLEELREISGETLSESIPKNNEELPESSEGGIVDKVSEKLNTIQTTLEQNREGDFSNKSNIPKSKEDLLEDEITREHVKVIGVTQTGNQVFPGEQSKAFKEFLENGENKTGQKVYYSLGEGVNENAKKAIAFFNKLPDINSFDELIAINEKEEFSGAMASIINYLPIKVTTEQGFTSYITARPNNNHSDLAQRIFTENEVFLRRDIIVKALQQGKNFDGIFSTIEFQYPGKITNAPKVDGKIPENSVLDLNNINDYSDVDLYFQNVDRGTTLFNEEKDIVNNLFLNNNKKQYADSPLSLTPYTRKGYIYTTVPMANGRLFPLKLNVSKVSQQESKLLFNLFYEVMNNNVKDSISATLTSLSETLQQDIKDNFKTELSLFKNPYKDIMIFEFIDLFIYDNANSNSYKVKIENGNLLYGETTANKNALLEYKDDLITWLQENKRRHISIKSLSEESNLDKNKYKKYLLENKILNTDAVVNEPLFKGNTNIYVSKEINVEKNTNNILNSENNSVPLPEIDNTKEMNESTEETVENGFDFMNDVESNNNESDDFDFFDTKC